MHFVCRLPTSLSGAVEPGSAEPRSTVSEVPPRLLLSPELPPGAPAETFPAASTHQVLPDLSAHGQLDADRLVRPPRRSVGRTGT